MSTIIDKKIAGWILGSLREDEAPRCPDFPKCGGEDGHGVLSSHEHREARHAHSSGLGSKRAAWAEYVERVLADAPRCKECKRYARAVERTFAKLTKVAES